MCTLLQLYLEVKVKSLEQQITFYVPSIKCDCPELNNQVKVDLKCMEIMDCVFEGLFEVKGMDILKGVSRGQTWSSILELLTSHQLREIPTGVEGI